ncbi:lipopolysaccharide biosynthesis protein [Methylocella silvestris BL2]|uniref:Lipopolysaccharide biosynthesis protein n=1 Tax=Methylocella silvestris (strain DSM 15510 / CIP 108128 / LMG 27833 / NCIMB 13906 / BL2) TaxID=395965 RepID=B8ENN9_METSB|nr:LPS biosynthesis protein [Methylocella silvestris]ACK50825.1 lipopolysaccharide biosynthesis protein [Methylocella silvestris BL2]
MHWLDWEEPRAERRNWFAALRQEAAARRAALFAAALTGPLAIIAFLMAATPQYQAEAQIFVAAVEARPDLVLNRQILTQGEALLGSRDLARRAMKSLGAETRPELSGNGDMTAAARALIFLGAAGEEGRPRADERALEAFQDRLSVKSSDRDRIVTIAFRSDDADFSARAANRVAALFVEAGAEASQISARVIAPARPPQQPVFPTTGLLAAIGAAAALVVGTGCALLTRPLSRIEEPLAPPRAIGDPGVFLRLKEAPGAQTSAGRDSAGRRAEAQNANALEDAAARILAARRPSGAIRILGARLAAGGAADVLVALARLLDAEGRSIMIDLAGLTDPTGGAREEAGPGLSELISGEASFAEVISRDPSSRLHFLPRGRQGVSPEAAAPGAELSIILQALEGAYDFIWLTVSALEREDMIRTLSGEADFVVLTAAAEPREAVIVGSGANLAGWRAKNVLVIGAPKQSSPRGLSLDAA